VCAWLDQQTELTVSEFCSIMMVNTISETWECYMLLFARSDGIQKQKRQELESSLYSIYTTTDIQSDEYIYLRWTKQTKQSNEQTKHCQVLFFPRNL
jgi:hypothetical protein